MINFKNCGIYLYKIIKFAYLKKKIYGIKIFKF